MMTKIAQLVIGFVISGIALYYFISVTPDDVVETFIGNTPVILITFLVLIPAYALRAVKYFIILRQLNVNFSHLSAVYYAGIALNSILPFRLGDVFRVAYTTRFLNIRMPSAILSLIIERVIDLGAILTLLCLFTLIFYSDLLLALVLPYAPLLALGIGLLGIAVLGFISIPALVSPAQKIFAQAKQVWTMSTRDIGLAISTGFAQWLIEIPVLAVVLSFFVLGDADPLAVLSTFGSNLATLVPSAPGYVGTFEAAGIAPFELFDYAHMQKAASLVLILHSAIWLFSVALGLMCMVLLPQTLKFGAQGDC